jgi:predicted methyltransferase
MRSWLSRAAAAAMLLTVPVVAVQATSFASLLSSNERTDADRARDADRKPVVLMAFAGIRPGLKVVELAPGGGYFTRLLTLAVGPNGHIYTGSARPNPALTSWASAHRNVTLANVPPGESLAPVPVDVVWTTQNYHDFKNQKVSNFDAAILTNRAAFAALKPGGVYLVSDHEAAAGAGTTVTSTLHRIESAAVIREVEAAGFRFEARNGMLRNSADNHTLKVQEGGIRGHTDQFVLRFRKPKADR